MSAAVALASASRTVGDVLSLLLRVVERLSVFDWILIGAAVMLVLWGWVRAAAFARLGTIEIEDVATDDKTMMPIALKAELQNGLGHRGLLPPSGVPGGTPTKKDLSTAVATSPAPQAAWIGALINVIPFPPTSMSFKLSATVVIDDSNENSKLGLAYRLVSEGPTPSVKLDQARGATWPSVIDATVKDVYRSIAEAAPSVYPRWARWASSEALTKFGDGLEAEEGIGASQGCSDSASQPNRFDTAFARFREASDRDPDNMLARLRAANCLERGAGEVNGAERLTKLVDALEAYISIRLRQPGIFEAGYRSSVLLSSIARELETGDDAVRPRLADVVRRLAEERNSIAATWPTRTLRAARLALTERRIADHTAESFVTSLERAAARESRRARRRLAPLWTIAYEGRFRHRFEPTGHARRQLRKALRISKLCIDVRSAQGRPAWYLFLAQLWWRGAVITFSLGGRPYGAGWQADYNAACFYALLLKAWAGRIGTPRIRRMAIVHLQQAFGQSGHELQCHYVRDEDPDLEPLRRDPAFKLVIATLCPEEQVVHVSRAVGDGARDWTLHAWGDAIAPSQRPSWDKPLLPADQSQDELIFRVRIFDENKPLNLLLHVGDHKAQPEWLIPPVPKMPEVWLYLGDATVRSARPASWPRL